MSEHTPGPWEIGAHPTEYVYAVHHEGAYVADVYALANARLIAAAPDLLAACGRLLRAYVEYQPGIIDLDAIDDARTAIAKAHGETQP